ncbi:MAG: PDZ domain-containing protein [Anaerolineales bacterium]
MFNLNGEVVGINQSILTNNTNSTGEPTNSGVGFSVSINLVKRIVPVLIQSGTYKYPYLGISSSSEMPLGIYEALGLTTYKGVYVREVTPGGPADQAGLKGGTTPTSLDGWNAGGDIILAMDGKPVDTYDQLLSQLVTTKSPGDTTVLTILRNGQQMDITVTLGERP